MVQREGRVRELLEKGSTGVRVGDALGGFTEEMCNRGCGCSGKDTTGYTDIDIQVHNATRERERERELFNSLVYVSECCKYPYR